jgi:hypothetical protein
MDGDGAKLSQAYRRKYLHFGQFFVLIQGHSISL